MLHYKAADVDSESSLVVMNLIKCLLCYVYCLLCFAVASHLTYMLFDL